MSELSQNPRPESKSFAGIARSALVFVLLSILGMVLLKYCKSGLPSFGGGANSTSIPKELHINYIPAEYNANIDEDDALVILSNPQRYRRDFDRLIYDFNLSLLRHVANRMDLGSDIKADLEKEYQRHHGYLKDLYYQDFMKLKDTTDNVQQLWYENENAGAVEILNEVASKYTCSFINNVITTLLKSGADPIAGVGKYVETPCGIALKEGIQPMIKRLAARAAIEDFSKAKGMLEEKVEKAISELATMEVRDKKGLSKQLNTKVLGFNVSETDIEVSAISILKVGFKLNDFFEIRLDDKQKTVTVTLPEPQILSHEVYPKIDKLHIGWMREVQNEDFNRNFNLLRQEFRRDALDSDIMSKAKQQAVEIMDLMFSPVVARISKQHKLQVRFKAVPQEQQQPQPSVEAAVPAPDASE